MFRSDPGVGFCIIDAEGVIRYTNFRACELCFKTQTAEEAMGKSLGDFFDKAFVAERMVMFQGIIETGKPVIMRHIRDGVQLQSTIRLLENPDGGPPSFLITIIEGEHEPENPEAFEIVESKLVNLGPLDPLTRREIEVLALIGHGMSTKQIADTLHRSPRTIERHCDGLREKLNTANRVQLSEFARRAGLRVEDATLKRF